MKLQHLAIVFVIIILPISMVITSYIQTQIDTIALQSSYGSKLQTATHDAIKAFQLNTLNNKYSTLSDSKIRDIEASISTFYNSLGTELGASGYDRESLQQFIPAIVYTMYDGYYIYGKYKIENNEDYQYCLKPYIYYSCRYVKGNNDFVVNYTLDNSITIYGKVNGEYVTKSGSLISTKLKDENDIEINLDNINDSNIDNINKIKYNGVIIEPEILKEQIIYMDVDTPIKGEYEYTIFNNQKIYIETIENKQQKEQLKEDKIFFKDDRYAYFRYQDNKKLYVSDSSSNSKEKEFLKNWTQDGHLYCNSAIKYYINAAKFSKWVNENLKNIKQGDAVDANGNKITDFAINTGISNIFELDKDNNNPLLDDSPFNCNRTSVIRKSIESNLNATISSYSSNIAYDFRMPKFTEEDWDKLENNIAVATFMQGIPIGAKYFNSYCIITNNKNEEIVSKDSIYVITDDNRNGKEDKDNDTIHVAGSMDVIDNENKVVIAAYKNIDFEMQEVVDSTSTSNYYYPKVNQKCYECIINTSQTYDIDDIIAGTIRKYNENTDTYEKDNDATNILTETNLRKVYVTALARERYNLYKTNEYFGIENRT